MCRRKPGCKSGLAGLSRLVWPFFIFALVIGNLFAGVQEAGAQSTPLTDSVCPDTGSCSAGDVHTSLISSSIVGGDDCVDGFLNIQATLGFSSTASKRYDLGFFVVDNSGANDCAGAVPPPTLFDDIDEDACGDLRNSSGTVSWTVTMTVPCTQDPTTGNLRLDSCRVWQQNPGIECSTLIDTLGTGSKCDCEPIVTTIPINNCEGVTCAASDDCHVAGVCNHETGLCSNPTAADGTACGGTPDVCENQDTCLAGVCQDNGLKGSETVCHEAGADATCDPEEVCDGEHTTCPVADTDGTACGGTPDVCENQDTCLAGVCQDNGFKSASTACGDPASSTCDNPDHCSGIDGSCVANHVANGTSCGDAEGACTNQDTCLDGACHDNGFKTAATACGDSSSSACDNPDHCSGTDGSCVANHVANGTNCGDAEGACTNQDKCDGAGNCHDNGFKTAATACGDQSTSQCDGADHCSGTDGSCVANHVASGTNCGDAEGACTNQDKCDGAGNCHDNGFKSASTACGSSSDTECDNPDHCSGTDGTCVPNHEPAGTTCTDTTTTDCKKAECDGNGICNQNYANQPSGTSCSDTNACTLNDTCDGSGVCRGGNHPTTDPGCVKDTGGADDAVGQKDLTQFCQNAATTSCTSSILTWQWDDVAWSGGNTGDACALYDTNGDSRVDYALCVIVNGSPAKQASQSPRLYKCGNTKEFNCSGATLVNTATSTCTVNNPVSDPFGALLRKSNKCNGTNCLTKDIQAQCCIKSTDLPATAALIDVCSYPSQSPSSDPSECVKSVFCTKDSDCSLTNSEGTCSGKCQNVGGVTQCVF